MLVASRRVDLLDRYRVPYRIEPGDQGRIGRISREDGNGPELLWVAARTANDLAPGHVFDGTVLRASVAPTLEVDSLLGRTDRTWRTDLPIVSSAGGTRSETRRAADGSMFLPFDIDAPLNALLSERYLTAPTLFRQAAERSYYALKRFLPRRFQLALRRGFHSVQDEAGFPAWPIETSLHRLEGLLLSMIEEVAGEPLPWMSFWPEPYTWALVLTHDVERLPGYQHVNAVWRVEEQLGLRSAWYFVPERDYRVGDDLLDVLREAGCEICLHGLRHDGRDLSPKTSAERLPLMRRYAEAWGARGFRAPSTLRTAGLIQQLGLDHDSSWSDVARYEPRAGGSCSWIPYFLGEVVELPITMPQDHVLFNVRGERSEQPWNQKAAFLKQQGGMALILTHPDYLLDPALLDTYRRFLDAQSVDPTSWRPLPGEVADWWRRRHASSLERVDGEWVVSGPAAGEAQVRLGRPPLPPPSASASVAA